MVEWPVNFVLRQTQIYSYWSFWSTGRNLAKIANSYFQAWFISTGLTTSQTHFADDVIVVNWIHGKQQGMLYIAYKINHKEHPWGSQTIYPHQASWKFAWPQQESNRDLWNACPDCSANWMVAEQVYNIDCNHDCTYDYANIEGTRLNSEISYAWTYLTIAQMDLLGEGVKGVHTPLTLARWGAGGCYFHDRAEKYDTVSEYRVQYFHYCWLLWPFGCMIMHAFILKNYSCFLEGGDTHD